MVSSVVQAQDTEVVGKGTEELLSGPRPSGCLLLQSSPKPLRQGGTENTPSAEQVAGRGVLCVLFLGRQERVALKVTDWLCVLGRVSKPFCPLVPLSRGHRSGRLLRLLCSCGS